MTEFLPLLVGGIAIFIYSINRLSKVLEKLFSNRAKESIKNYTSNLYMAILIGAIITIIFSSSSAVIIITIIFVNASTLNFRQSVGIVMGANIGTTFSSQLIAFDIENYSVFLLVAGILVQIFSKKDTFRRTGQVIFYFGLLFYGLFLMQQPSAFIKESRFYESWIAQINNNYLKGVLSGGVITLIIQSSSATVGLIIAMSKQNLISISSGISVMLGAELGTCSNTLLATINGNRDAIKTGIYHLVFNLTTIIIGILLFTPFVNLVEYISAGAEIERVIANAHIAFNLLGVIIFLPFVRFFEKGLNFLLPNKQTSLKL